MHTSIPNNPYALYRYARIHMHCVPMRRTVRRRWGGVGCWNGGHGKWSVIKFRPFVLIGLVNGETKETRPGSSTYLHYVHSVFDDLCPASFQSLCLFPSVRSLPCYM